MIDVDTAKTVGVVIAAVIAASGTAGWIASRALSNGKNSMGDITTALSNVAIGMNGLGVGMNEIGKSLTAIRTSLDVQAEREQSNYKALLREFRDIQERFPR